MNLPKMIAELQDECDRLDQAILALERLSAAGMKRRGRSAHPDNGPDADDPANPASPVEGLAKQLN